MFKLFFAPLGVLILVAAFSGCGNTDDNNDGIGNSSDLTTQQIGEAMVSIDESSGNASGTVMSTNYLEASCSGASFAACGASMANAAVKNFGGCTIAGGLVSVSGTVTLSYTGTGSATCTIPASGDSVSRVPAFTATLVGGAAFTASALSTGQILTRTGGSSFTLNNTGIRRVYTSASGATLADMTTMTTSDITISGTTRTDRVINGGALQVKNNLTSQVCTATPNNVAWTSMTCNCPTSGTWTGSCSTGESLSVAFSSTCGQVATTFGSTSKTLTIDRCN
ncbi:hypothetical protein CIK05_03730 [Bdellovibrio sp. qaytius]|nr:hypothetical protein CIK05_03730 [Bdellovibrio sp. qaytius]